MAVGLDFIRKVLTRPIGLARGSSKVDAEKSSRLTANVNGTAAWARALIKTKMNIACALKTRLRILLTGPKYDGILKTIVVAFQNWTFLRSE